MSDSIDEAVKALSARIDDFDGNAKFVFGEEGTIMLDSSGARAGDGEADVTLTAEPDTFRAIFEGELDPTAAFMSGKLSVDGDMGQAMKLAGALS